MSEARRYHHGDLRNTLIVAAAELIDERGTLDFSITEAAQRAGVSNAAPYRHFKDREDLLIAVRDLALMGLSSACLAAQDQTPQYSMERLIALGQAYLDYAEQKKPFLSLMWEDRGDMDDRRANIALKQTGFQIVVQAVADYCSQHSRGQSADPIFIATQLWALAHGIATLQVNQMLDLFDQTLSAKELLESSVRNLLTGLER